jgi:hypothetical protein
MSATCPIKSHPAYVYAVDNLNNDKALEIYDALGNIPRTVVDAHVKQRDAKEPVLVPNDSKRKAYVGGKDNNGLPFTNINNDRSWEIEKKTGLNKGFKTINGKAIPQYMTFSMRAASEKIAKLAPEYPGFAFIPKDYTTAEGRRTLRVAVSDPTFPVWANKNPNQQLKQDVTSMPKEMLTSMPGVTKGLLEKVAILQKAIPWRVEIQYSTEIAGIAELAPGGRVITINPKLMTTDAIGHEFGHIFIDILGGMSNSLIRQGREQLKGSAIEAAVIAKYPELANDERLDKEIITTALGVEVAKIFDEQEKQTKFMRWLIRFFRSVRAKLGIEQNAVRQLAERLVAGEELHTRSTASAEDVKSGMVITGEAAEYVQYSKDLTKVSSIMDKLLIGEEKLLEESLNVIQKKIAVYSKRDPNSKEVQELQKLLPTLEKSTTTAGMIKMVRYASNSTNRMNNTYLAYLNDIKLGKERTDLNARLLDAWRTHVASFQVLSKFKSLIIETKDQFSIAEKNPKDLGVGEDTRLEADKVTMRLLMRENKDLILDIFSNDKEGYAKVDALMKKKDVNIADVLLPVLNRVLDIKEKIENLYVSKGRELMVDWLAPMAGLVEAEYRERWEQEWRKLEKKPMPLDKFLAEKQLEFGDQIKKETRDLVERELDKANADIPFWKRYADTILNSPDVISSAIAKVFFKMQEQTRKETLNWRYQFADKIAELEKAFPRPIGMSDEKYFDMFLETDPITGERTDYIVTEIPTQLITDYVLHKAVVESGHFLKANGSRAITDVDKYIELNIWKEKYAPRRKEEWQKAQEDFVQGLLDQKMITTKERDRWVKNSKVKTRAAQADLKDMFENFEAVNALIGFKHKNNWTYRDVHAKYTDVNQKWKALEKIRKTNPNDVRIAFYDFLVEASDEAENNLPISYRLGSKLPSMHKEAGQKIRSNEKGLLNSVKQEISERLQLQKYDLDKGERTELVNEANEPVYFVPTYYINDIGETTYVLDENAFKKLRAHDVPTEVIDKLKTIKDKVFDSDEHFRDFLKNSKPDIAITPLSYEEINKYIEYIVFDARKKDLSNKSFDLTSIYYNYLKMSIDFRNKFEIQHEAEMARFFVNNRDVIRRDSGGKPIQDALTKKLKGMTGTDASNPRVDKGNKSELSFTLDAFYKDQLYGMSSQEEPDLNFFGYKLNQGKLLDGISGYTAVSLLGVNFVAGFANVALGEMTQAMEAWSNEVFGAKDMTKATGIYYKELGGMLGDIGERRPTSLLGLLNDEFDTLNEYDEEGNMIQGRWYANMMKTNTLFFTSHVGEHYMQTRAMLAMLNHIKALDSEGNEIGTILDYYKVNKETKQLEFDSEGKVSNWNQEARENFSARMHRSLARMHGEYSSIGRSEMQQAALGRMAIMFRRFVVPGFKRRWESKQFNNLYGDFTEGNYRTFGRFIKNLSKDLVKFQIDLAKEDWSKLSNMEKANIRRTLGEIGSLMVAIGLGALALRAKEDDDKDSWALNMATYQALRLKSELLFFINPAATLQILRSPMASISFAQSLIELVDRGFFYPITHGFQFEVYQTGTWKEHLKVEKTLTGMFPVYKQIYRVRDIGDQLSWFNK